MPFKRILAQLYLGKLSHLEALAKFQDLFRAGFAIDIDLKPCRQLIAHAFNEPKIYKLFVSNGFIPPRKMIRRWLYKQINADGMAEFLLSQCRSLDTIDDILYCAQYRPNEGSIIEILLSHGISLEDIVNSVLETRLFNNSAIMAALLRRNPRNLDLEGRSVKNPQVRAMLFNRGMCSEDIPISGALIAAQQKVRTLESLKSRCRDEKAVEKANGKLTEARHNLRLCRDELKRWKRDFNFALEKNIEEVRRILDEIFSVYNVTDEIAEMLWYIDYSKNRKRGSEEDTRVRKKIRLV